MTTETGIEKPQDDFFNRLLETIKKDQLVQAFDMIVGLETESEQVLAISALLARIIQNLDRARSRASMIDLETVLPHLFDTNRPQAADRYLEIAVARDLAQDVERVLNLPNAHALARALNLARDLDRTHELAIARNLVSDPDRFHRRVNARADVLDSSIKIVAVLIQVLEHRAGIARFTLSGIERFTTGALAEQVAPYLEAVVDLQTALTRLRGEETSEPRIVSISQQSPFTVQMEGVADVVRIILDTVVPWRRKTARQRLELEVIEKEIEVERQRIELEQLRALGGVNQAKAVAELEGQHWDNALKRIAYQKERLALEQSRIELAFAIVEKYRPAELTQEQRFAYAMEVVKALPPLTDGPLEISRGIPLPPSTLPE